MISLGSRRTLVAVAAPQELAVAAATEAVAEGGNAIDAALAAAALLVVAYPHQCALGGDLTALVRDPGGAVTAVLSLGAAPAGVDVEALRAQGERMPTRGALSVTVPGIVAGWRELAGLGATLGLRGPLLRAAAAAADGVEIVPGLGRAIVEHLDVLRVDPGLRGVFTDEGELLTAGDTLRQPALAATLETLAHDPSRMYSGEIGAALVAFLREGGSAMTPDDFAAHAAERPRPLTKTEGAVSWWVAPPPSQGATLMALLGPGAVDLTGAEPSAVDLTGDIGGVGRPQAVGPLARARAAQGARNRLLGDPRGGEIDVEGLLDPFAAAAGDAPPRGAGDTVAIAAVDDEGRSVALIQSNFYSFGSGMLEQRTGVLLHNRGSYFLLVPGHPGEIGPGRRPPHTLCPLLAETGETRAAIGSQGGSAQPLILSQVAAAALDPDASLDDALARPRWVVGDRELGFEAETVLAEPGAEATLQPELAAAGAPPLATGTARDGRCGHVQIARSLAAGKLEAASDPRADGTAVVTR